MHSTNYKRRLCNMQNDIFNIDISLEELFQFIFWKTHYKKYSSLCRHLKELQISFLLITPDKNGEIRKIVYEKENEFTVRNKYLIDGQFLEPLGLNLQSLVYSNKISVISTSF